jgi:hypothetical protein
MGTNIRSAHPQNISDSFFLLTQTYDSLKLRFVKTPKILAPGYYTYHRIIANPLPRFNHDQDQSR